MDLLDAIAEDQIELLAYCGHPAAISRAGKPDILHLDELNVWLGGLRRWGTQVMVRAALVSVYEAFSLLDSAPWIRECSRPLLEVAERWVASPTAANAASARIAAENAELLAKRADELSTMVGDWWSYEAVETCGIIPAAIALESKLIEPNKDIPGPPTEELRAVCYYFSEVPSHVKRSKARMRQLISDAIVSCVLGRT